MAVKGRSSAGARAAAGWALLVISTVVAYWPAMTGAPIWDDVTFIFGNPLITEPGGFPLIWASAANEDYWPVTYSAFRVLYSVVGDQTPAYHAFNLTLHLIASGLVVLILKEIKFRYPMVGGFLFALHPVQVESVAWIIQAKTLLATALGFAALLALLRYGRTGRRSDWGWGFFAFVSAMLAKTSALMLPPGAWLLRPCRRIAWGLAPWMVVGAALAAVAMRVHRMHYLVGTDVVRDDSWLERVAGAGRAAWFYAAKVVFPVELSFVYPRWSIDVSSFTAWLAVLGWVVLVAVLLRWRRPAARVVLAGVGFYLFNLAPVLGLVDIPYMQFSFVADHWQYAALAGPAGLVAYALSSQPPRVTATITLVLALAGGVLTWQRARLFTDEVTLFSDAVQKAPSAIMVRINLGQAHRRLGNIEAARAQFEAAVKIDPQSASAQNNLASILAETGEPEQAARHYRAALAADPAHVDANYNLANLLSRIGRRTEAIALYRRALAVEPDRLEARNNLATALVAEGRPDEAVTEFRRAAELAPEDVRLRVNVNVARAELAAGKVADARRTLEAVVAEHPDHVAARLGLGLACAQTGDLIGAIKHYERALSQIPAVQRPQVQAAIDALRAELAGREAVGDQRSK